MCPSALGPNSGAGLRGRAWSGGPSVMDPGLDVPEKLTKSFLLCWVGAPARVRQPFKTKTTQVQGLSERSLVIFSFF